MTEPNLKAWIEDVAHVRVTTLERLSGGGSREAWRVDATNPDGTDRPLFLRRDLGVGPVSGSDLTLAREARVCQALERCGIPVSDVIAYDEEADIVLVERAAGGGAADRSELLQSPHRTAILADFISVLARIHNLDPLRLDLPDLPRPQSGPDHALLEVRHWRRLYQERAQAPDPILEATFSWLERNAPEAVERTVLVHGDCGPGNFMFEGDHVTCVVDWEFAHFGDPMDDIAWLGFRQHLSSGQAFDDLGASLAQWSRETGLALSPGRISYYGLLVLARCATCSVRGLANAGASIDNAIWHQLLPQLRRAMAHLLADLNGVIPDVVETPAPWGPTDTSKMVETLRRDLAQTLGPELVTPNARKRAVGMGRMLDVLALATRLDPRLEAEEVADLRAAFGRSYGHSSEALADLSDRIASGGAAEPDLIRYLCRRADRAAAAWLGAGAAIGAGVYPDMYRPS